MTVSNVYLIFIAFRTSEDKEYKTIGSLVNTIKHDNGLRWHDSFESRETLLKR